MNPARRAALALALSATTWPAVAATDYFWNCTTPDGTKYADASKCDKGDTAVKVMKGNNEPTATADTPMVQMAQQADAPPDSPSTGVCPANPAYCSMPDYGATEASPRAQAITQFMREKQCEFLRRFPERCAKSN